MLKTFGTSLVLAVEDNAYARHSKLKQSNGHRHSFQGPSLSRIAYQTKIAILFG